MVLRSAIRHSLVKRSASFAADVPLGSAVNTVRWSVLLIRDASTNMFERIADLTFGFEFGLFRQHVLYIRLLKSFGFLDGSTTMIIP